MMRLLISPLSGENAFFSFAQSIPFFSNARSFPNNKRPERLRKEARSLWCSLSSTLSELGSDAERVDAIRERKRGVGPLSM